MELNPWMPFDAMGLDIFVRLLTGTCVGMLLGIERELKGFDAGLRTHGFVALSAALMTVTALVLYYQLGGRESRLDPLRVIEGMAAAIGIIAAGLIIVRGDNVKNLTSAAHIWLTATLGIASGAGLYPIVLVGAVLALALLILVGMAEKWLPRSQNADE
jgi:putative Mg2+ transporter-C (MgtC) family protein